VNKLILVSFVLIPTLFGQSGSQYPFAIAKGDTVVVPPNLKYDTLYVITENQYKKILKTWKDAESFEKQRNELLSQMNRYKRLDSINLALIKNYKEGYIHYYQLWEKSHKQHEETSVNAHKKWAWGTWGVVLGFVLGTTIAVTR